MANDPCFLCGESWITDGAGRRKDAGEPADPVISHVDVMNAWKERCVVSTCRILRIPGNHPGAEVLLRAEKYCGSCVQVMRDVEFSVGAMDKLQRQIRSLRQTLLTKLNSHWETLQHSPEKKTSSHQRTKPDPQFAVVFEKVQDELASWTDVDFMLVERNERKPVPPAVFVHELCIEPVATIKEEPNEDVNDYLFEKINIEINEPDILSNTHLFGVEENVDHTAHGELEYSGKISPLTSPDAPDSDPDWIPNNEEDENEEVREEVINLDLQQRDNVSESHGIETEMQETDDDLPGKKERRPRKTIKTNAVARKKKSPKVVPVVKAKKSKSRYVLILNKNKRRKKICCPFGCTKKFRLENQLDFHTRNVHKGYTCDKCHKTFFRFFQYSAHLQKHLKTESKKQNQTKTVPDHTKCAFCGIRLKLEDVEEHEGQHRSREFPFSCLICEDAKFERAGMLAKHMQEVHPVDGSKMCHLCGRIFSHRWSVNSHIKAVHEGVEGSHPCDKCGRVYKRDSLLQKHIEIYHSAASKRFVCEECGKVYITPRAFKNHLQRHSNDNPFKCKICGKGFKTSMTVRRHEGIHSGLQFQCPDCPKTFSTSRYLTQHARCHLPRELRKYYYKTKPTSSTLAVPEAEAPEEQIIPEKTPGDQQNQLLCQSEVIT